MKRILVVLAALVLVFAVACNGDNPAPSSKPAINTSGASEEDLRKYAEIGSEVMYCVYQDPEVQKLMMENIGKGNVSISNQDGTLVLTGTMTDNGPKDATLELIGYSTTVDANGSKIAITVWGKASSAGAYGTYDFTIRIDDENKTFEYYSSDSGESVNGIDIDSSWNDSESGSADI